MSQNSLTYRVIYYVIEQYFQEYVRLNRIPTTLYIANNFNVFILKLFIFIYRFIIQQPKEDKNFDFFSAVTSYIYIYTRASTKIYKKCI